MRNSVAFVVVPYPTLYYRPIAYILMLMLMGHDLQHPDPHPHAPPLNPHDNDTDAHSG